MPIRDYCRENPSTATRDESVHEAARRMEAEGVGSLVVVDAEGRPVGLLTDRDVVVRVLRRRRDPDATLVGAVMHGDPTVVHDASPLVIALRRMRADGVRRIPVVNDEGKLVGIFTSDDALQLIASELSDVAAAVRSQFPADPGGAHALRPGTRG